MRRRNEIPFETGVRIREDLTQANQGLLNRAFNHTDIEYAYSFNGKLHAVTKDRYRIDIDIFDDLGKKVHYRNEGGKGFKVKERNEEEQKRPRRAVKPREGPLFTDLKAFGF